MNEKLVSIAMATYNGGKFLRKQLDSIYSQSYKNIEVIVCDDCSIDDTAEILKQYNFKHGLKYYINDKNLGFVKNFEKAITLCTGEYIALADQDDLWHNDKIETLIGNIGNYALICSDAAVIDGSGSETADSFLKYSGKYASSDRDYRLFTFYNFVTGCTCLFKRELLSQALPFPEYQNYHDWWLALCASKMSGVKFLDTKLVDYRQHGGNVGGAEKSNWLFFLFGRFFNRFFNKSKHGQVKKAYYSLYKRCCGLYNSDIFNSEEKKYIKNAIIYYEDILKTKVHFKAFKIALKYSNYIFPETRWPFKLRAILETLFK
ncbi:MAG: glycosyltransferase family 2 protein [Candidatus Wallbacteria bacterium]